MYCLSSDFSYIFLPFLLLKVFLKRMPAQ